MIHVTVPFFAGLSLMIFGVLEASTLSAHVVEVGQDEVELEQVLTFERRLVIGHSGVSIFRTLIERGRNTVIYTSSRKSHINAKHTDVGEE